MAMTAEHTAAQAASAPPTAVPALRGAGPASPDEPALETREALAGWVTAEGLTGARPCASAGRSGLPSMTSVATHTRK
jgi:hypothetical protein